MGLVCLAVIGRVVRKLKDLAFPAPFTPPGAMLPPPPNPSPFGMQKLIDLPGISTFPASPCLLFSMCLYRLSALLLELTAWVKGF